MVAKSGTIMTNPAILFAAATGASSNRTTTKIRHPALASFGRRATSHGCFSRGAHREDRAEVGKLAGERTGNICIEYRCDGRPSGISTTEADMWVHELKRDGATLGYLMFPMARLKEISRKAILAGRCRWRRRSV
jgi:hypothetical protein